MRVAPDSIEMSRKGRASRVQPPARKRTGRLNLPAEELR
jgi:hypothetical protein